MNGVVTAAATIVTLEGRLEIREVGQTYRLLVEQLARSESLSIDLAGLSALDTAGAQLLLAVKLEAGRRGVPVIFCGHSEELNSALELLGLRSVILQESTHGP